jgi:ABC-type antimicrobial peptide transport system permease subunit
MKRGIAQAALAQVLGLGFTFVLFIALTAATQQPWLLGWLLYAYLFPVTLLLGIIGAAISVRRARRAPP